MEHKLNVYQLMLLVGTRVALGIGIGLLLSSRLSRDQRKAAGLSLAVVGGLTTIPLALELRSETRGTSKELGLAA